MEEKIKKIKELVEKIETIFLLLKIKDLKKEKEDLEMQMQDSNFWKDVTKAKEISQKYEKLNSQIEKWENFRQEIDSLYNFALDLEKNLDANLEKNLEEQINSLETKISQEEFLLFMSGKHDKNNAILYLHAGSGGVDAQDWTEMLMRMYVRFSEIKDWKVSILEETKANEAGIKTAMLKIEGDYAYGFLKVEHGTHRLVRISPFDGESLRHTSFALVEVLPELEIEELEIDEKDLRIDTFMAGGHGGQSVNTTYSAVRVVHIPTNITVSCQNERSQLQNKLTAIKILKAKLEKIKELEEEAKKLKLKGDYKIPEWGSQIRSYVLNPYKMVKDLRSGWETTEVDKILNGELEQLIISVIKHNKK